VACCVAMAAVHTFPHHLEICCNRPLSPFLTAQQRLLATHPLVRWQRREQELLTKSNEIGLELQTRYFPPQFSR
jgi:hypothetical protein